MELSSLQAIYFGVFVVGLLLVISSSIAPMRRLWGWYSRLIAAREKAALDALVAAEKREQAALEAVKKRDNALLVNRKIAEQAAVVAGKKWSPHELNVIKKDTTSLRDLLRIRITFANTGRTAEDDTRILVLKNVW